MTMLPGKSQATGLSTKRSGPFPRFGEEEKEKRDKEQEALAMSMPAPSSAAAAWLLAVLAVLRATSSIEVEVDEAGRAEVPWVVPSLCARARLSKVQLQPISGCADCEPSVFGAGYVITSSKKEYKPRHPVVTGHLHEYGLAHKVRWQLRRKKHR